MSEVCSGLIRKRSWRGPADEQVGYVEIKQKEDNTSYMEEEIVNVKLQSPTVDQHVLGGATLNYPLHGTVISNYRRRPIRWIGIGSPIFWTPT